MQAAIKPVIENSPRVASVTQHKTRDDLLLLATNRFCDADTHSRLSMEQYKEAFYLLVGKAATGTKQIVARTLSHSPFTPRSIGLFFALENVDISAPMLKNSMVLGQLDLLQIIEMKGEEAAAVIAKRPDIGPSVVKRLEEIKANSVQSALLANRALVNAEAHRSADALFNKIDLRKKATSTQMREPRAEMARTDAKRNEASTFTRAESSLLAAASRGGRTEEMQAISSELNAFDFGPAVEKMAKARSHQGIAVLMQKRFGLTYETTQQVLSDKTGDTLAVLLRAANVEDARANRIQLLIQPSIGLSTQNAKRAIRFYAQLGSESCLEAVAQWPKMDDMQAKHQPHLEEGRASGTPERNRETRNADTAANRLRATG